MEDEITINLRCLSEQQRIALEKILLIATKEVECEINERALLDVQLFEED